MHKLERDGYLALSALLSLIALIWVVKLTTDNNRLYERVHKEMKAHPIEEQPPRNPQDRQRLG